MVKKFTPKEFAEWKSLHVRLTEEQIPELLTAISALHKGKLTLNNVAEPVDENVNQPDDDDWLWEGIQNALRNRGWLTKSSSAFLRTTSVFRRYKRDSKRVRKDLESLVEQGDTRNRTVLAYMVGLALIIWVERRPKMPQTAWRVVKMVEHAREALEEQLPGYTNAKMFRMILNGHSKRYKRLDRIERVERHG